MSSNNELNQWEASGVLICWFSFIWRLAEKVRNWLIHHKRKCLTTGDFIQYRETNIYCIKTSIEKQFMVLSVMLCDELKFQFSKYFKIIAGG